MNAMLTHPDLMCILKSLVMELVGHRAFHGVHRLLVSFPIITISASLI